jgi:hypothetical protein
LVGGSEFTAGVGTHKLDQSSKAAAHHDKSSSSNSGAPAKPYSTPSAISAPITTTTTFTNSSSSIIHSSSNWEDRTIDPDELSSEDDAVETRSRSTVMTLSRPSSSASNTDGVPPSIHRPHRHSVSVEQALHYLASLEPLDKWEFQQEKNGVKICTLPIEGGGLPLVRGDGMIEGNFTLQEVHSVIRSSNCRKMCKSCLVIFTRDILFSSS